MVERKIPNTDELKYQLNKTSTSYLKLLQDTHDQALSGNETQTARWETYRAELGGLTERLLSLRDELSPSIMVPLGRKALMRGRLQHTNELIVCLGDGWFAKQTAKQATDICQRRIDSCNEMLEKLEKERVLLTSRHSVPLENDAFGNNETEVLEPYDEEAEKQWRESHRQKEKEYRQKLAELRKSQNTKIETQDDLWKRLDALDMQEELEDELNRLEEDDEDEDEGEFDDESEDDNSLEGDEMEGIGISEDKDGCEKTLTTNKKSLKRRVSFKEDTKTDCTTEKNNESSELVKIVFRHSDTPSYCKTEPGDTVQTPADIYTNYFKQKTPKSILKSSPSVEFPTKVPTISETTRLKEDTTLQPEEPAVQAITDNVVERTASSFIPASDRPVSQFKAARMASKR